MPLTCKYLISILWYLLNTFYNVCIEVLVVFQFFNFNSIRWSNAKNCRGNNFLHVLLFLMFFVWGTIFYVKFWYHYSRFYGIMHCLILHHRQVFYYVWRIMNDIVFINNLTDWQLWLMITNLMLNYRISLVKIENMRRRVYRELDSWDPPNCPFLKKIFCIIKFIKFFFSLLTISKAIDKLFVLNI